MSETKTAKRGRKAVLTDSARKRRRREINAKNNKNRIYIGMEYDRWNELKNILRVESHAEVAKILLDRYEERAIQADRAVSISDATHFGTPRNFKATSTPVLSKLATLHIPDVSYISSSDYDQEKMEENQLSGVEEICATPQVKRSESSFVNPFDLTFTLSEGNYEEDEDNSEDDDYEPSLNATLRTDHGIKSDDSDSECLEEDNGDPVDENEVDLGPSIKRIRDGNDVDELLDDNPFLVYLSAILTLAKTNISPFCTTARCSFPVSMKTEVISSALYLKWICQTGHLVHKWCSQPIMNRRLHSLDLIFSASILLSGNNYQKIADFARCIKLPMLCNSTYLKIQRTYLVPSIDRFWTESRDEVFQQFEGKDIVIMGDGRMDSPGHCAQFCTYTFMEYETKKILCIVTMDKRMTEKNSSLLEKACFLKGLRELLNKNLRIVEVVTDAHPQIESLMKKQFSQIKHSFDIWHGAKNLGKKVVKVAKEKKETRPLLEWTRDIVNHFWHCADKCHTKEEFVGVWFGIIHHSVNKHQWMISYSDYAPTECDHGPLSTQRDKGWLTAATPPHDALIKIVMDKILLKKIPYYVQCRSTAELENFQNVILKYASKRHSYGPNTYAARNKMAALDHNAHIDRKIVRNKDGSERLQRYYSKKGGNWTVNKVKEPKRYEFMPTLLRKILMARLEDNVGMNQKVFLELDDPRRLSATIAPVPPPPSSELLRDKVSRFSREDPDRTIDYDWQS